MYKKHKRFERYALFGEVAKLLSFSKAAESLGISRSYLSSQIHQLEQELQTSLLIRSTRSVRLTSAGAKILASMTEVNGHLLEMEKALSHTQSEVSGTLRITAPTIFSHRYLLDLCTQFQAIHPNIRFDLDIGYTREDLATSNFDLAIRATNTPPETMVAKKIMTYHHICCASPSYLAQAGTPVHPEDLRAHNCLSDPHLTNWRFSDENNQYEIATDGDLLMSDNALLRDAAVRGKGIIKLPSYLVQPQIDSGELVAILTQYHTMTNGIYLIYPPQLRDSKKLTMFVDFIAQRFSD
ncbi:LysR family transcriptional regulator [Vibrio mexicanus]|uniref:LysR family transcriptional regulator n=1 Tax=Vibrio mexicanus TaxID=1004326 RepID=UPI00063BFB9B|nr:LysR family transcriptional regulator [Vibrio mexicanus]